MSGDARLSKVEDIKTAGDHLRGTIAAELAQDTAHFSEESVQL